MRHPDLSRLSQGEGFVWGLSAATVATLPTAIHAVTRSPNLIHQRRSNAT